MSKHKKKNKKLKHPEEDMFYETIGDEINTGVAYLQAASLLDLAAVIAVQSSDTEGMTSVAHQWMEMAVLMQGPHKHDDDEEPEESFTDTKILGFGTTETRKVAEDDARKSRESKFVL